MERENAFEIVERVIEDLTGRRGLSQEWDGIDSSIKAEIKDTWIKIVMDVKN